MAKEYPPGFFTELMRRHQWPPMFKPVIAPSDLMRAAVAAEAAARGRATQAAGGGAWARGTIKAERANTQAGWAKSVAKDKRRA